MTDLQRASNLRLRAKELEQEADRLLVRAGTVQAVFPGLAADLAGRADRSERKARELRATAERVLAVQHHCLGQ